MWDLLFCVLCRIGHSFVYSGLSSSEHRRPPHGRHGTSRLCLWRLSGVRPDGDYQWATYEQHLGFLLLLKTHADRPTIDFVSTFELGSRARTCVAMPIVRRVWVQVTRMHKELYPWMKPRHGGREGCQVRARPVPKPVAVTGPSWLECPQMCEKTSRSASAGAGGPLKERYCDTLGDSPCTIA